MDYEISPEMLRRVQLIQLEILIEFDRICKENNLSYQLFAGTLLGAIRHKGFIPWDDDIDVAMLRIDYEKLIEICKTELNEKYFLQTYETDPNYIHSFARIRKNKTIALQKIYENIQMHHGIFIDVFPIDNISLDTVLGRLQKQLIYPFRKMKRLKIKNRCINSRKTYFTPIKLLVHYLLKPISMKTFNRIETRIATIFNDKDFKHVTSLSDGGQKEYSRFMFVKEEFKQLIEAEFEGRLFLAPKNYNKVLTKSFGDYMSLPPDVERRPHHGFIKIQEN